MPVFETFKNVLIADDDADDQMLMKEIIQEYSGLIKTTCIGDGRKLMEYLAAHPAPDLLFLDLNMPYKTGLECLAEIRSDKKLKNIPIVVFSTSRDKQDADMCFLHGAELFYSKPWDIDACKKLVHSVLETDWTVFKRPSTAEEFFKISGMPV